MKPLPFPPSAGLSRHLYLLIVALFAGAFSLQKIYDYDVWWHLRSGAWIVAQGAFPEKDPFSFATADAVWPYLYGVADPCYYLLYDRFGSVGLQFFVSAIVVVAVTFLFLFLLRRGLSPFGAALLAIWTVVSARFRFVVRPLVFKFVGIVFLFWFFFGAPPRRYRYPLFFLAVLLWGWLYPAAVLAQVFAAFLLLEKLIERYASSSNYVSGELRDALTLLVLASLALLINPNGIGLYKTIYGGIFADYAAGSYVVEEHQALNWSQYPSYSLLMFLAGISFWPGRKNFRILTLLIYVSFGALAWGSVRYVGIASFAMAGVVGVNLTGCSLPGFFSKRLQGRQWSQAVAVAGLVACCSALWLMTFQKTRGYEFGLGVKQGRFPFAAVQLLKEAGFSGNIYNSWKFGGFLQWHLPAAKTFIDGRYLPAQRVLYERFQTIELHEFSRYLTENQVQAALLDRQALRDIDYFANMPGYRQVYADDISVLFARSDLALTQQYNPQGKYRYLRLGGYEFEYLAPLATGQDAPLVEEELLRAVSLAPDSFFENFLLAYFYEARKDDRAAAQYLVATKKNPAFALTHFDVGRIGAQAALRTGQWGLVVEIAALALEYQKTGEMYFLLGAGHSQLKEFAQAEKAYRTSLALAENSRVRNNLGFLLLEINHPDAARSVFAEKLENAAGVDRERALYGLARALSMLQRGAEAAVVRNRLATEFPKSSFLDRLP